MQVTSCIMEKDTEPIDSDNVAARIPDDTESVKSNEKQEAKPVDCCKEHTSNPGVPSESTENIDLSSITLEATSDKFGDNETELPEQSQANNATTEMEADNIEPAILSKDAHVLPVHEPSNDKKHNVDNESVGAAGAEASSSRPRQCVYHVKWIKFKGDKIAIITQNENGPCPLLAILNSLLLQGKIKLPVMTEIITSEQLMEYLGDCVFENAPKNLGEESLLNYEQNMSDAMAVFDKLQTGLDVNVRFTGVQDFEYTRECIVFDLLGIPLYHGWLADPQHTAELAAVAPCSYNQLVEKIIEDKHSAEPAKVTEALVAEEFLTRTGHQLTYHGLSELNSRTREGQPCVFFRNNHFSTLLKHQNELFTLVTDQGFLSEPHMVWETLCNVEGDGHFVDEEFVTYRKPAPLAGEQSTTSGETTGTASQIDTDYLVALSLQEQHVPDNTPSQAVPAFNMAGNPLTDMELAQRLQEEEDRQMGEMLQERERAAQQPASQPTSQRSQPASRQPSAQPDTAREKKKNDCVLL